MSEPEVKTIMIDEPITVVGKIFVGDYSKSSAYVIQIQKELEKESIPFVPNKVLGVYYDNPQEKKPEEVRSFQGVFIENEQSEIPKTLEKLSLKGKYLYVKIAGDPMKAIYEGYGALFNHIQEKSLTLKTSAGYQISTFDNGNMITEIYMELV